MGSVRFGSRSKFTHFSQKALHVVLERSGVLLFVQDGALDEVELVLNGLEKSVGIDETLLERHVDADGKGGLKMLAHETLDFRVPGGSPNQPD